MPVHKEEFKSDKLYNPIEDKTVSFLNERKRSDFHITRNNVRSTLRARKHVSNRTNLRKLTVQMMKMTSCPKCGEPLAKKGRKRRYYCENESCPVIFVRNPNEPAKRTVAYTSLRLHV